MCYSIEPRERRYVKGYGFLSFAKNFGNKYGKKLMNTAIKTGTNFNSIYSLTVIFTVTTGVVKKLLNIMRKKKKKHNKIIALARSKLNIIETLISQVLIHFDISHEELSKIIYEKNNYEQIRDSIRSAKSINDLNKENDLNEHVKISVL